MVGIKELKGMVGQEGMDFGGKVKEVWERKTGEGEYGPYSFQNISVTDGHDTIIVSLGNREEVTKKFIGLPVSFKSVMNDKQGKKMGVKVVEEKYEKDGEEKKSIKAKVTASAEIIWGDIKVPEGHDQPSFPDDKTKSMIMSYAKDLVVAGITAGFYKDETAAGAGYTHWFKFLTAPEPKEVSADGDAPF